MIEEKQEEIIKKLDNSKEIKRFKELELELEVTKIYSFIVNDDSLIKKEIKNIIIKK